ncbi:MAG TPA: hypothetical protein VHK47_02055 [Polyangia bacterium]|nr:hypothetical protein [Polyangia bacterium]
MAFKFDSFALDVPSTPDTPGAPLDVRAYMHKTIEVGGFVGTIAIEASLDGASWAPLYTVEGAATLELEPLSLIWIRVNVLALVGAPPAVDFGADQTRSLYTVNPIPSPRG